MSQAFKCDGCREFHEGTPNRICLTEYHAISMTGGWTKSEHVAKVELCTDCTGEMELAVEKVIGEDNVR